MSPYERKGWYYAENRYKFFKKTLWLNGFRISSDYMTGNKTFLPVKYYLKNRKKKKRGQDGWSKKRTSAIIKLLKFSTLKINGDTFPEMFKFISVNFSKHLKFQPQKRYNFTEDKNWSRTSNKTIWKVVWHKGILS